LTNETKRCQPLLAFFSRWQIGRRQNLNQEALTMTTESQPTPLRFGLPKGRMADGINRLLADASIRVQSASREYRPEVSLGGFETKLLKPQAIVKMLQLGSRDIGFAGADWVGEFGGGVVELLDTGLDPVRVVVAAPGGKLKSPSELRRPLVVASEFERLTEKWIARQQQPATFLRSFGTTEVYPPEDADCIIDVVATGATLKANGLDVIEEIMTSTTRLYAAPAVLEQPSQRARIDELIMLLQSVLSARRRVMVEINVTGEVLERVVNALPCMREPTISPLHGNQGYAIKVAAPRQDLPALITKIKALGGTDIVVSQLTQIVP
jgi:ATP phosphoribosyltransferase